MGSPIFDATFGTGRFKSEEPMTTDQSQATPASPAPSPEPQDMRGLAREAADTISRELAELGVRVPDDLREPIASEIRKVIRAALAQSDAEPNGIDLDDADRAYDKWAEHRNGQSRLDAFRAGVEFGLRHTAPPRPDASAGLLEAAEIAEEHAGRTAGGAQYALEDLAATLRARATDRSGE